MLDYIYIYIYIHVYIHIYISTGWRLGLKQMPTFQQIWTGLIAVQEQRQQPRKNTRKEKFPNLLEIKEQRNDIAIEKNEKEKLAEIWRIPSTIWPPVILWSMFPM